MPDAFDLLDVPARFDLDPEALRQRMLERTAASHPDRFDDPVEQADAAERTAALNGAYRELADPERRARLLLKRAGQEAGSDDDESLPPAMLMEVMEVREELEAATEAGDAAKLAELRRWAEGQRAEHFIALEAHFGKSEVDGAAVRKTLNALRYVQRMLEQMPQ